MALSDQYQESINPQTIARVSMAMCKAAQDIGASDPASTNYANRTLLATRVSNNPPLYQQPFTTMVCAEGITSASTDAEISVMVAAVWDTMAGHA